MDILEPVAIEADDPRVKAGAADLFRALQAQQSAEDARCNCPECDDESEWWTCGPCSERYGLAIEMRHEALVKVGALRVVALPDDDPATEVDTLSSAREGKCAD